MSRFVRATAVYRAGDRTLPGECFTSPEIFQAERARIFRRRWVCVGREAEVQQAGHYLVASVGGESIIVVRDHRGELHALHNVCRHRGTQLCEHASGSFAGSIQCPYHAWTYALDGRLIGAPHMKDVEGFRMEDYPLHAVRVGSWEGFLFVNLDSGGESLADAFAPVRERFSRFNVANLRPARRMEYDVRANWKLVAENYSECSHCPVIHPDLARLTPYDSGENDLTDGPFLGGYMVIRRAGGSMTASGAACSIPVGALPEEDHQRVYFYTIFPNLLLSLHPDYVMYHTLWPQSSNRTRIVCEWLFHPRAPESAAFDPGDAVAFWDQTNRQDWHVCELSQAGVSSAVYASGPYSPREGMCAAWDREYRRQMGVPPT